MKWIDLNEVFAAELAKPRRRRLLPIELMGTTELIELVRRQGRSDPLVVGDGPVSEPSA